MSSAPLPRSAKAVRHRHVGTVMSTPAGITRVRVVLFSPAGAVVKTFVPGLGVGLPIHQMSTVGEVRADQLLSAGLRGGCLPVVTDVAYRR